MSDHGLRQSGIVDSDRFGVCFRLPIERLARQGHYAKSATTCPINRVEVHSPLPVNRGIIGFADGADSFVKKTL